MSGTRRNSTKRVTVEGVQVRDGKTNSSKPLVLMVPLQGALSNKICKYISDAVAHPKDAQKVEEALQVYEAVREVRTDNLPPAETLQDLQAIVARGSQTCGEDTDPPAKAPKYEEAEQRSEPPMMVGDPTQSPYQAQGFEGGEPQGEEFSRETVTTYDSAHDSEPVTTTRYEKHPLSEKEDEMLLALFGGDGPLAGPGLDVVLAMALPACQAVTLEDFYA